MPFFSVIIPSFNREHLLARAIDSVLAQDESDYELIVVDDGSTDGTHTLAERYRGKLRYIRQNNAGVSSARNRGISRSSSPWITLLDSDDTWHSSKLRKHKEFIFKNPEISIHQTEDIWIRNGNRVNPGKKHLKREGDIFAESLELCMISPSSVCISESIIEKYGLFDEFLPACEDYDLWLRITPFEKVGLVREKLITRYAGHTGQLSSAFDGMDRFRVYSILKLLSNSGEMLSSEQRGRGVESALRKSRILLNGSEKRKNEKFSAVLRDLISSLEAGYCTRRDYQNLLQI